MSTEIMLPFQLGPNGTIATVSDDATVTDQHVQSLISTVQGERVMLPTYGLSLAGLVFGGNDPILVNVIQNEVSASFAQWEPNINLLSVAPAQSTDAQSGVAAVNVEYQASNANVVGTATSPIYQQATMSVGGTITNDNS
jgi:phage baseplate assembly protein W